MHSLVAYFWALNAWQLLFLTVIKNFFSPYAQPRGLFLCFEWLATSFSDCE
jgi:hypothetical protein